jgi:hypothetical protein
MAKLSVRQIQELAVRVIRQHPDGIRYSEPDRTILMQSPETPKNTIHGATWNLAVVNPAEVTKPARGLFKPREGGEDAVITPRH